MSARLILASTLVPLGLSACASPNFVAGHPTKQAQYLHVAANVDGARATSEYGQGCDTPCNLPLLADRGGTVTVTAAGYASQRHRIGSEYLLVEPPAPSVGASIITGGRRSGVMIGASVPSGPRRVAVLEEGFLFVELVALGRGEPDPLGPDEITSGERLTVEEYEARER